MINLAQVGIGYWGSNLLRVFSDLDGARLRVACDIQVEKHSGLVKKYSDVRFIADYRPLLEDPGIDAVIVATPAETHYAIAKEFLTHGKHVFVEKPFVLDLAHAEELVELADSVGRVLMVGHLLLYHPAYVELRRRVHSLDFGDLHYVVAARASLGQVRQNENVLWSFAPHDVALLLQLIEEKPVRMTAMGQAFTQPGIEDVCFLTMLFPSGRMAHIHTSWMFPRKVRLLTAVGSKQMIEVDDTRLSDKMVIYQVDSQGPDLARLNSRGYTDRYQYEAVTFKRGDTLIPYIDDTEPLKLECQHFVDCIREEKEPLTSGKASLEVVRTLAAAQQIIQQTAG